MHASHKIYILVIHAILTCKPRRCFQYLTKCKVRYFLDMKCGMCSMINIETTGFYAQYVNMKDNGLCKFA